MSLQGTFDTLSVPELFGLLSTANKTGALRLEAGEHAASVSVSGGLCCAVESAELSRPAASAGELATRLVDVGFAFARHRAGSFRFSDADLAAIDTAVTTPLEPAVVEILALLDQWREIEATIPSLDARVRLAPVMRDDQIVVSAQEWGLLVAVEGGTSVRDLIARRRQPMMQVCRDVKALVDRGAVEIEVDVADPDLARPVEPQVSARGSVTEADAAAGAAGLAAIAADALADIESRAGEADAEADADAFVGAGESEPVSPEADAVVAGIVSRMGRGRRPVPDVFADGDDPATSAATDAEAPDPDAAPAEVPVAAGVAAVAAGEPDASQDRGALLRLFSALKES